MFSQATHIIYSMQMWPGNVVWMNIDGISGAALFTFNLKLFSFQVHDQVMETYHGYNCIVLNSEEVIKAGFIN